MDIKILPVLTKEPESRTTCTLSFEGKEALDCLTKEFGLTQKQIFGYFINGEEIDKNLIDIVIDLNKSPVKRQVKKCLVINKRHLDLLNYTAKKSNLRRDEIIDFGLKYLVAILKNYKSLQKKQHINAAHQLDDLLSLSIAIEDKLKNELDDDSPILQRMCSIIVIITNLISEVKENIENNTQIDPYGI